MEKIQSYVTDINSNITCLGSRGPCSKYELPEEGLRGRIELKFFEGFNRGIACKLDSVGYQAMVDAFTQVRPTRPVKTESHPLRVFVTHIRKISRATHI